MVRARLINAYLPTFTWVCVTQLITGILNGLTSSAGKAICRLYTCQCGDRQGARSSQRLHGNVIQRRAAKIDSSRDSRRSVRLLLVTDAGLQGVFPCCGRSCTYVQAFYISRSSRHSSKPRLDGDFRCCISKTHAPTLSTAWCKALRYASIWTTPFECINSTVTVAFLDRYFASSTRCINVSYEFIAMYNQLCPISSTAW